MQRIKSFLGWGFAAFFGMLLLGSLASNSSMGTLVLLLWVLICLPPMNRAAVSQGVRYWVWWKIGIFVIGFFLIGIAAVPEEPAVTTNPPPVISSPAVSESPASEEPTARDRSVSEPSPSPIASPSPEPEPEPVVVPSPSPSATPVSTGPIREPVSGSCDCPYDTDSAGRRCGGRSAYSRPGGSQPVCYFEDR